MITQLAPYLAVVFDFQIESSQIITYPCARACRHGRPWVNTYMWLQEKGPVAVKRCKKRRGTQCRRKTDKLLNTVAEQLAMETDRHWMVDAGRENVGDWVGKAELLRSGDRQCGTHKKVSYEEERQRLDRAWADPSRELLRDRKRADVKKLGQRGDAGMGEE